jgi:hypothetical protein
VSLLDIAKADARWSVVTLSGSDFNREKAIKMCRNRAKIEFGAACQRAALRRPCAANHYHVTATIIGM